MEEIGFARLLAEIANVSVSSAEKAIIVRFSGSAVVSILCRKGYYVMF